MQNTSAKLRLVHSESSSSKSTQDGWIFSKKIDLVVFLGPLVLAGILLFFYSSLGFSLELSQTPEWALAFFFMAADLPHVYSTLFRTYWDPTELASRKLLYYVSPPAIFLVSLALCLYSTTLFWHLFAYFNIYHLMRQSYGWVNWSARKGGENDSFDVRLNKATIYYTALFPILWLLSRGTQAFWFTRGDFPNIFPRSVGASAHVMYWVLQALYIGRQIYLWRKTKSVNWLKQLLWFSTSLVWYLPMVVFHEKGFYILGVALQTLTHAVPYLFLTFRYGKVRWQVEPHGFPGSLFTPKGMLLCYVGFVAFAALQVNTELLYESKSISQFLKCSLIALAALPQLTHFYIDGFIWRPSKDKNLRANLDGASNQRNFKVR